MNTIKQLDIWWVDLEPVRGFETQKQRPCVVLQSDVLNKGSKTFIVAPILPDHKDWLFAVNIVPTSSNGMDKDRHVNIKQLRVVDGSRFVNKQGILEDHYFDSIDKALDIIFKGSALG